MLVNIGHENTQKQFEMVYIWLIFIGLTFYLSTKRLSYGCGCLLLSRILVPECVRLTPIMDVSLNTAVISAIFFVAAKNILLKKSVRYSFIQDDYIRFLCVIILVFFCTLFLSSYESFLGQLSILVQFFITDIVPVFLFVMALRTKQDVMFVVKVLLIVSCISCLYGILTIIIGFNPYVFFLKVLYESETELLTSELGTRGGVIGTSSTFLHANGWGYFLPITFVLFVYLYKLSSNRIYLIASILVSIGVFICSKRSALIAYMSFYCFYFCLSKSKEKFQMVKWGILLIICSLIFVFFIPQLDPLKRLIESSFFFWDDSLRDKNDVGGSSWELRVLQVFYPWRELNGNLIFGNGFGWCTNYLKNYELHPVLFGFETIFSTAVLEGGVVGVIVWISIFLYSYRYSKKHNRLKRILLIFTWVQIVIAVATGFSYFIFYGLYIVILNRVKLLMYYSKKKRIQKNAKSLNYYACLQYRERSV